MHPPDQKFPVLINLLKEAQSAVLAFSGGVDSSFLLKAMKISGIKSLAVTADSETIPGRNLQEAIAFAAEAGIPHLAIRTEELTNENFTSNPPDRCFYCKDELFGKLLAIAEKEHYRFVFDGSNSDDLLDYRPGMQAAKKNGVRSPLAECGFTKSEIRHISRELGIPGWDRPSSPCLSSRFPYHHKITPDALRRVEKSEEYLRSLGFRDVRVRDHGDTARIEVGEEEMEPLFDPETRHAVSGTLRSFGYAFVSLDLEGFKSGKMNRALAQRTRNP